jgi:serine/threonine protein kinase
MPDLIGRTLLSRYRVVEQIGRGGMAEVYKLWDHQRATYLAIKLLREGLARDPTLWFHFQAEAKTLESLQHPNIVRFYGLEQDGPLIFMLMEYVEGTNLRVEIQQNKQAGLSPQRVLAVMEPVCKALHFAHQTGKVHRDVKPANILIGNNDQVYLADFGVADLIGGTISTPARAGTPNYMAPEQIRGEAPTPQTDIYALGVIVYEMLTGGMQPFSGERAPFAGSTREKILWEHQNLQPVPMRSHYPNLNPGFDAIVARCLEKDPRYRYQSTMEFLVELKKVASSTQPIEYQPETKPGKLGVQQDQPNPMTIDVTQVKPVSIWRPPPRLKPGWLFVVMGGFVVLIIFIIIFSHYPLALFKSPQQPNHAYGPTLIRRSTLTPRPTPSNTLMSPTLPSGDSQPHNINECMQITITRSEGAGQIFECITGYINLSDGNMIILLSWTAYTGGKFKVDKQSDVGNTNIYLKDNLGNRYDHILTAGAAHDRVEIQDGQTVDGWFLFPPLASGASSFIFYDDDNSVHTAAIKLQP